ncbi:hypothetical protein BG011_006991 [Mortierella polycephala]|uniref:GRIP domain-containing protein n=1 Tax=Mortierella polycephala TaxID=41804 RepID=A0A9P6TYT9_9FUNG|nr:hypothetical protein BG011_006991 [Mortierella polycephala]
MQSIPYEEQLQHQHPSASSLSTAANALSIQLGEGAEMPPPQETKEFDVVSQLSIEALPTSPYSGQRTSILTPAVIIPFSILGLLIRLGLVWIETFAGQQVFALAWPQFVGCFLMGFFVSGQTLIRQKWSWVGSFIYVALTSGLCGSITTFSSWNVNLFIQLINSDKIMRHPLQNILSALAQLIVTLALSTSGLELGRHFGEAILPPTEIPVQPTTVPPHQQPKLSMPAIQLPPSHWTILDAVIVGFGTMLWIGVIAAAIIMPTASQMSWRHVVLATCFSPPGAILRWFLSRFNPRINEFPVGTFIVNVGGSALLAGIVCLQHSSVRGGISPLACEVLSGLQDGFCGKLSTSRSALQTNTGTAAPPTGGAGVTGTSGTGTGAGTGTGTGTGARSSSDSISSTDPSSTYTPTPSTPQTPTPQGHLGSIASRFSSSASSSSLFFRRPLQLATRSSSSSSDLNTHGASVPTPSLVTATGIGAGRLALLVQQLTLDPKDEKPDPDALNKVREHYRHLERTSNQQEPRQQHEQKEKQEQGQEEQEEEEEEKVAHQLSGLQLQQDRRDDDQGERQPPAGTELSEAVIQKLEILQRYEARFPGEKQKQKKKRIKVKESVRTTETKDLAGAFKKIVQEKMAAEAVLKATTALEDLGDVEALEAHLQNLTHKSQMSMQEIGRLVKELQAAQEAQKTMGTEAASQTETILDLQSQVAELQKENERLRKQDELDMSETTVAPLRQEYLYDLETKVNNSLDLSVTTFVPSPSPSPPPRLDTHSPAPDSAVSIKEKKSKSPKMKDQALRELMVRLEAVLKEKNQAQEEQEEAVEQANQLRIQLEKEMNVNREMSDKMDLLQTRVAEMEERGRREAAAAAAADAARKLLEGEDDDEDEDESVIQDFDDEQETPDAGSKTGHEQRGSMETEVLFQTQEQQLTAMQKDLESLQSQESKALMAKQEAETALTTLQLAHTSLEETLDHTRAELEAANTQIKDLRELAVALGEAKQDLVEAQEEVQEKQQLLDLERSWREEAETSRDRLKREQETHASGLRLDFEQALNERGQLQEKVQELEGQLSSVATELKRRLERIEKLETENDTLKSTVNRKHAGTAAAIPVSIATAVATATMTVAAENDATSLEELVFLKQERGELSEKLTRLERLHRGFERSSSERIRTLEQELAVLIEQKVALEAQVQEQSDLLIKEKQEKEKEEEREDVEDVEVEQARVAEGIERVRLELAAVRTAERFASSKVTELTKDRDRVIEKVVKLEKRLETLKECKVGQEQSLTGRIEELAGEKANLEKEVAKVNAEVELLKGQVEEDTKRMDEMKEALKREHDQAQIRVLELEAELANEREKVSESHNNDSSDNNGEDTAAKILELEEKLMTLTTELQTKTKKLAIAQEQAQVQRTVHEDRIAQLSGQIRALETERDSLAQPKDELETMLKDATERVAKLEQELRLLEEDNERLMKAKTEAQKQMTELQSRITALGAKERYHNEALALAKDTIHQRDEDLSASRKTLQETETKLEKTVEMMTKLEKEKLSLKEEMDTAKSTLSKAQQEIKTLNNKMTSQQSTAAQELQKLKMTHLKTLQERDRTTTERDQLQEEKETNTKEMRLKLAELETLQQMNDSAENQMREYQTQLTEARNRVDTLEEVTSIAKRVAETKVVELESLRARSEDLEQDLTKAKERMKKREEELRELRSKAKQDLEETRDVFMDEVTELTHSLEQRKVEVDELKEKERVHETGMAEMKTLMRDQQAAVEKLEMEVQELTACKRNLSLELQHFKDLEVILAKEKDAHTTALEEIKMREGHLRTVNKTLKEEVRKLQRQLPNSPLPSPSTPHSPYSQGNMLPQTPTGTNSQQQQYFSSSPTPGTSKSRTTNGGRAFSTPTLSLTPPATPRFNRRPQQEQDEQGRDVNVEYLKNVLLNFMEHKDRRQQLIPVVAQMLCLSVDETRRFAKVV